MKHFCETESIFIHVWGGYQLLFLLNVSKLGNVSNRKHNCWLCCMYTVWQRLYCTQLLLGLITTFHHAAFETLQCDTINDTLIANCLNFANIGGTQLSESLPSVNRMTLRQILQVAWNHINLIDFLFTEHNFESCRGHVMIICGLHPWGWTPYGFYKDYVGHHYCTGGWLRCETRIKVTALPALCVACVCVSVCVPGPV